MSKQAKLAADTVPAHEPLRSVGLPLEAKPLSYWLSNEAKAKALPRTLAELLVDVRFCRKLWGPGVGNMGRRTILSIDGEMFSFLTGVDCE